MALYFGSTLEIGPGCITVHSVWHKVSGFLAVCSASESGSDGIVNVFTTESEKRGGSSPLVQRSCQPTLSSWHPIRNLLAVGWENGEVLVWNDHNQELHEIPSMNMQTITAVQWSSNGARLATGDKVGVFAVWRADERGRVQHNPICRIEIGGEITQCIIPSRSSNDAAMSQIASLARAAVRGDEKALDHFSTFDDKKAASKFLSMSANDGLSFFCGSSNGEVHFVDGKGKSLQCLKLEAGIRKLLYFNAKDALVCLSSDLQVILSRIHADGKTEEMSRVKLSGQGTRSEITWAGDGLLAASTSDRSLRLWDLNTDDNFALSLESAQGFKSEECITCMAYSNQKRILAAGTNMCRVAMWIFSPNLAGRAKSAPEQQWRLQQSISVEDEALHLEWCFRKPILAVNSDRAVQLLTEQKMNWAMSTTLLAVQSAPKHAYIEIIGLKSAPQGVASSLSPSHQIPNILRDLSHARKHVHLSFDSDIFFTGISAANDAFAIWNSSQVTIYDVANESIIPSGSFAVESVVNALHDQSLFTVESKDSKDHSKIQVRNFKGTVKQVLQFQDSEGDVCLLDVCGNFMVAGTSLGFLQVFDLSRRDVKPYCATKNMAELIPYFGSFSSIKCNCGGTKIAMIVRKDNLVPNSRLYVYDVEVDRIQYFDFNSGQSENDEAKASGVQSNEISESRLQSAMEVAGRFPVSVHWDVKEPRLLVCEAQITDEMRKNFSSAATSSSTSMLSSTPEPPAEVLVVSLFSTPDEGILIQDSFVKSDDKAALIGLKVPNFYFTKTVMNLSTEKESSREDGAKESSPSNKSFTYATMRDFVGLEECDETTQQAMLDFSYYLTIGNMDEAFKAIKLIKSDAVWESMAKMCVKTRRVDVAKVCLGRMGHVRGAHALRDAEKEPEMDARVAMLALQLGMNDEAERLYKKCQRYDLLNKFYQAIGKWGSALEVAEQNDRIHLRTTYHNYAKHLEQSEDIAGAIPHYEKAGTHSFEVPRMLFDDIDMLETYILKSKNKTFLRWWAQYMESTGEMDSALKYYEQAGDILSLVRVYCYCGNVDKASAIANETGNCAACYHLARHFENSDDIKKAIHFYTRAATYGNAIRICKQHGFEDQLMNLALLSSPNDMIEAAAYYEDRQDTMDKAVMLYHKAGHFSKALKLAFDTQQFGALELIAQDLDERADPLLLERCANFFMEHEQYDKAVGLLIIAKKYSEAVDLCYENNVKLDETLVEKLTVPKDEEGYSSGSREKLLTKLADCCMQQGAYHLACKKYTQAGDKEKAMRALLKSGDTEKIIFFAGVSRSRNIYIMAANYLQSLDWRKDPEIMKAIISYYTKGRALHSLAGFYDACAQVEIDEYQNYDKAMGALTEAFKCLTKAKMIDKQQQEEKVTELKTRIALVKKFIQAKRLLDTDAAEAAKQCQVLLAESDIDSAVRIGDIYGLLIENYAQAGNNDKAYQMMQEMRSRIPTVNMAYYVNMRTIEDVHEALGLSLPMGGKGSKSGQDSEDDDEIDDNVTEEDIYNNGDSKINMYRFR